jgi:hypothetical protein
MTGRYRGGRSPREITGSVDVRLRIWLGDPDFRETVKAPTIVGAFVAKSSPAC